MKKKHTAKNTELDAHANTGLASADRGEQQPGGKGTNERTSERAKKTKEKTTTKTQQQR